MALRRPEIATEDGTSGSVEVDAKQLTASTEPLPGTGGRALVARVRRPELLAGAERLLQHVAAGLAGSDGALRPDAEVAYGFWPVRFVEDGGLLVAQERDEQWGGWDEGVDRAVGARERQRAACDERGSGFAPPPADAIAVATRDVFEAPRLEAVRYEAGENTCGWWFLTDAFTGDSSQVVPQHLYHLTAAYPQLTPFLALDVGWVVRLEDGRVSTYREP